ncbi:hypothetical protein K4K51_004283 [Colletotrichum sp. SAR 10_75]|nr:hypothetical protein K4K51_004283 [Colletotrichum sp. SAR 10_75]
MSDISDEDMKYLAENADRIVPYIPPGYFARINAKAKADRERKKEEEEEENSKKKNAEEKNDEGEDNEDMNDEEDNENKVWGAYPNEGLPIIFHFTQFVPDKDGNPVSLAGPKAFAVYYDEETGDYVGEAIDKTKQRQQQQQQQEDVEQQKFKEQEVEEPKKQLSSKPAPQRKPRTNLSLLKPIPAFPGYKNPDLRNEDWGLPLDQVDIKVRHNISLGSNQGGLLLRKALIEYPSLSKVQTRRYRQVMRYKERDEWNRSQYKLAVKDRKKAWKKASRRLKEGRGVVTTEVVQQPGQLEI